VSDVGNGTPARALLPLTGPSIDFTELKKEVV
jgi:hypothetical protein